MDDDIDRTPLDLPNPVAEVGIEDPPTTPVGILKRLGPGLIVAGSIVGSGELIATTAVGAEAGFTLMWLIIIGCVIKVFTQVELGRYSIVTNETTMAGLNRVPGPSLGKHGNWLVWFWFAMFLVGLGQLGGIVGSVGQAVSISAPLTETGSSYNEFVDTETRLQVDEKILEITATRDDADAQKIRELESSIAATREHLATLGEKPTQVYDDRIWATVIAVLTAIVLVIGRYRFIQTFSTTLVGLFTFITVGNLIALQLNPTWAVTWEEFVSGLKFQLPPPSDVEGAKSPLFTALATFGIIGVGASELVSYPYWCLEKGYARFTGSRDDSPEWAARAQGWMRVMRWDAWCSMVVYTFATIAFYLLGAAILSRVGLEPQGTELIRTLAVMYEPVFGDYAPVLFLFGAFAVLYSTFFVANASLARVLSDALRVLGIPVRTEQQRLRLVRVFSGVLPFICLAVYLVFQAPKELILASGTMQALMLPMLAAAALHLRYRCCDKRLEPGKTWDIFLWISAAGMLVSGVVMAVKAVETYS